MQVAVITGGSSGIGQSAAFEVAKRGVAVVVTYRGSRERGLETVERIEKDGGTAVALPLDVGRPETFGEFKAALTAVLKEWDRTSFDFLVSNAGVGQPPVMFEDTTRPHGPVSTQPPDSSCPGIGRCFSSFGVWQKMQPATVLTSLDSQSSGEPHTSRGIQPMPSSVQRRSTLPSQAVTPAVQTFSGGGGAASAPRPGRLDSVMTS